jgi:glycosyltransferase involved in cell wall biosynthesis
MPQKNIYTNGYTIANKKISGVGRYLEILLDNKKINYTIVTPVKLKSGNENNKYLYKKRGNSKFEKAIWNFFVFNHKKPNAIHNVALDFSFHSFFSKSIYTIHDLCFILNKEWYGWYERLYLRLNLFFIVHFSTRIICVSENTKKDLIRLYPKAKHKTKTIYISEHISNKKGLTVKSNIIQKHNLEGVKFFLSPTNKHPRKNLKNTISGFKKSLYYKDGYKIILTGEGVYNDPSIINTNYIDQSAYLDLLKHSEGVLYFPFYEGFGIPIIECVEYKKPIYLSQNSSLLEIFEKNELMCSEYKSAEGIANYLNKAYEKNYSKRILDQLISIKYKFNKSQIDNMISKLYEETFY